MRFELRQSVAWLREQRDRACLWRWEVARFHQQDNSPFDILYIGRKTRRLELSKTFPKIEDGIDTNHVSANRSSRTVFVSEMPIPGALCVPHFLNTVVPLGRPLEKIIATYDYNWRRSIRKYRARYSRQQVLDDIEINRAHREMLHPFASARHGSFAFQKSPEYVRRSAQGYGRLDFLLVGEEVVGCLLSHESVRAGKRYWVADRCGYPEAVFSDQKRLAEAHSMNLHIGLEWAMENGYDYYELGNCHASPDDRLLQFKRRRGTELNTLGLKAYGYFHIRLPKVGAAQFLWDTPLFSIERENLTLHLGLPHGLSDGEFAARYGQMGFVGLTKVCLHCAKPPDEGLLATLCNLYKHQNPPPTVEHILST
jgi:hypothetical protein